MLAPLMLIMIETAFCNFRSQFLRKQQSKKFSMVSVKSAHDGSRATKSHHELISVKEFSCYD